MRVAEQFTESEMQQYFCTCVAKVLSCGIKSGTCYTIALPSSVIPDVSCEAAMQTLHQGMTARHLRSGRRDDRRK